MRISKKLKKAVIILLAICEALFGASQVAFAQFDGSAAENTVVIGFIDSGIAPYNVDASHILDGKNYAIGSADTTDRIGHGTKTAGMVLGSTDGSVKGTFPEAYAVPLVVVDKYPSGVIANGGTTALVSAIYDAVDVFGCRIINISLCTTEKSQALNAAVDYACARGVILVCAAGNNADDGTDYFPAIYDSVISVGSSSGTEIAAFSQTRGVDFFYEGQSVPVVSYKPDGKTSTDSGTSFSCASVSGICASMLAEDPSLTTEDVRTMLSRSCIEGTPNILKHFDADEPQSALFADTAGHWAESDIAFCVDEGIFSGNGDGTFLPDSAMTRAMFVTVLWNMSGRPEAGSTSGFIDVADDAWYAGAVDWAFENGLAKGVSSVEFAPDSFVTREQVCVFLNRYATFAGHELREDVPVSFTDENVISDWAKADVALCASAGIIHGNPDRSFNPHGTATRAECCSILHNYRTCL